MAKVLAVSRSGYYRFKNRKPSKRDQEEEEVLVKIKESYERSRQTYGSPRIRADLREQGVFCSRKRISRLMKKAGLVVKMKKRFKVTTRVDSKAKVRSRRAARSRRPRLQRTEARVRFGMGG